jgi:hypothetical protein
MLGNSGKRCSEVVFYRLSLRTLWTKDDVERSVTYKTTEPVTCSNKLRATGCYNIMLLNFICQQGALQKRVENVLSRATEIILKSNFQNSES